ncbi:MAG: GNAT family N-acetyltransferase [Oscillospiraceae bacterium]|nr:GNAT family N-acetyltransferase [Oscillospiraceae bacterium]
MITYTTQKIFTVQQVQSLFLSENWVSGQYPTRLHKALMNSSTVITAWDGDRLVGLVRVIDDSEMLAYMHYVIVHPDYRHQGIANHMIEMVKEKYKNFLYIEVMPEESKNAAFYERFGFKQMEDGACLQLCNFSDKR